MPSSNQSYYKLKTIGEVSELVGVPTHVLRFWESKFKELSPQKRRGIRYYRPDDIELIRQIKSLLHEQGYNISGASKLLSKKSGKTAPRRDPEVTAFIDQNIDIFDVLELLNDNLKEIRDKLINISNKIPRI